MKTPLKDKQGNELNVSQVISTGRTRIFHYFLDFELLLLWITGYIPLHFVRRFVYKLSGLSMGNKSTIHMGARFYNPKHISIGDGTIVGDHVFLDGRAPLTIGNHTSLASQVMIYNSEHDLTDETFKAIEAPVTIGDYVFIGPRAIILPGVSIGDGAVVAAGAVVTKDIAPRMIVGGVPAKEISQRKLDSYAYRLGRFRLFQ